MRLIPILVLSFALVLAGCAKKDDGGGTTTTTSPGTTTTTKTTTTTTPTGTTTPTNNTNTTPTTPTKPAPQELSKGSFDFSQNTPAAPLAAKTVTIPAGYTMGNLTVTWTCTGDPAPCAASGVSIKVSGLTCAIDGPQVPPIAKCVKEGAVTAGDVKIEPAGNGLLKGDYVFTIS